MSTKLTPCRAFVLSAALLIFAPGCSLEDFDLDGDGKVTRAEALYASFLWLCEEVTLGESPEEPAPEEPASEEPTPQEPAPTAPSNGETPTTADPTVPADPTSPQ